MEVMIDWSSSCGLVSDGRKRMQQMVSRANVPRTMMSATRLTEPEKKELDWESRREQRKLESQQFEARREKWRLEFQQLLRNIISESGGEVAEGKELSCVQEEDQQVDNVEFQNSSDFDGREPSEVANDGVEHLISVRHEEIDVELEFGKLESHEKGEPQPISSTTLVQTDGSLGNQKEEMVNSSNLQSYKLSSYQKSTSYLAVEISDAELERIAVPPRFIGKESDCVVFELSDSQQLKKAESIPTARPNALVRELEVISPISAYYCVSLWMFIWYPKPMVKMKREEVALEVWSHDSLMARNNIKLSSKHGCLVSNWFTMEVKQELHKEQMSYANFSASLAFKTMLISAFNSSNHPSLKWLSIWVTKPMGKMKLMTVFFVSCLVFKGWGMTRATHMQAQHGEVIGGDKEKQFDLDVLNAVLRQQSILQYRDVKSNRTIMHLYVQFGQRSGRVFTIKSGVYGQLGILHVRDGFICAFKGMSHEFVMDISARFSYIVVLTSKREVYTWERYENRQLGLNHIRDRNSAGLVETPKGRKVGNITWESIHICCDCTNELQIVWCCAVLSLSQHACSNKAWPRWVHISYPQSFTGDDGRLLGIRDEELSVIGLQENVLEVLGAKKACRGNWGCEEISSAKGEEGEYTYSFYSDSLDGNLEGKFNEANEDWIYEVISEEFKDEASENVMGNSHPLMFTQLIDNIWKAKREELVTKLEELCMVIRNVLGSNVEKVIVFDRVVDYSCCSVTRKCGWTIKMIVEISSRNPKEELRKRVDYMAKLRELWTNCRKFAGLMTEEKEDSSEISVRVINESHAIDGKYVHMGEKPATSVLTEMVMVPLAGKMKLGKIRHKKLGSMIP